MKTHSLHTGQQGVVLIVSMILLVGVTVLALSSLHTGLMEILMSDNDEARTRSFQSAQSGIEAIADAAITDPDYPNLENKNFPDTGGVGASNCTSSKSGVTCDQTSLTLPNGFDTNKHWARIERLAPLWAPAPRSAHHATSSLAFKAAHFSVDSRYSDVPNRGGRSEVVQGYRRVERWDEDGAVIRGVDITAP